MLHGIAWEIVFVDDNSQDGTRDAITAIGLEDNRVRLLYRTGRRGLASAFIEGARCSMAPFVAAMDGDMQHDEALLPNMLVVLRAGAADIVVGSRYVAGGDLGDWDKKRAGMSDIATRLSRLVLQARVTDPMSGFFMLPRTVFEHAAPRLSVLGFKILLDCWRHYRRCRSSKSYRTHSAAGSQGRASSMRACCSISACCCWTSCCTALVPVRFVMFAGIGVVGLDRPSDRAAAGAVGRAELPGGAVRGDGLRDRR